MQDAIVLQSRSGDATLPMGWLRDFMTAAQPAVPSFGKLAQRCLEHPDWPADSRPKPRSLSTLFSKLDRKQDLDWLRDRIEVQQILCAILGRPLASLRDAIGESPFEGDPRFLRLHDVRYARDLDLAREALPPGIPSQAFTPPSWEPTWWWAPSGSGRSLAAQWLKARGLAHTASIHSLDELDALPPRGALFVDVDARANPHQWHMSSEQLTRLRAGARPLCIAAPFAPSSPDFGLLRSPPIDEILPELIDWVDARLDGSGHFQADRAEQWMRKVALAQGAVTTLGDALGLLGMLDETNPRSLVGRGLDDVGAHFVRQRVREANEQLSYAPRLTEAAYGAMRAGAARFLVGGASTLGEEHSLEEWTNYFATPQTIEQPDPEWFATALKGALGSRVSRRDLRRAAHHLEPSAFQLTRALEASSILVRPRTSSARDEGGAVRKLHPRWLVRLLEARAFDEALSLTPVAWGKVLFEGRRADDLIIALLTRASAGHWDPLFQVVEEFDESCGEHCAALEASTIVCGLLLLERREVPDELLEAIMEHTQATTVMLDGKPYPRLTVATPKAGLFHEDMWLASLCAISEEIPFSLIHLHPLKSPFNEVRAHYRDAIVRCLRPAPEGPLHPQERVIGLLSQLRRLSLTSPEHPAILQFLDSLSTANQQDLEQAFEQCDLQQLLLFGRAEGLPERALYSELWRILCLEAQPDRFFTTEKGRAIFWNYVSTSILTGRVQRHLDVQWEAILPHQYADLLDTTRLIDLPREALVHCPLEALLVALERDTPLALSKPLLTFITQRAGAKMTAYIHKLLANGQSDALALLLEAAPASVGAQWVPALPEAPRLVQHKPQVVQAIRHFLVRLVRSRMTGFEAAAQILLALETELRSLRSLPSYTTGPPY